MATIETNLAGLKQMGKEFLVALPTATPEEIQAGWNCFALAYLGAQLATRADEVQAVALYNILAARVLACSSPAPLPH
jgi:hypothetical protein